MRSEDGKRVLWGATIKYFLIRSVAAGLVATAIIVVAGVPWERLEQLASSGQIPPIIPPLYLLPLAWPALVFLCCGTFYMVGRMMEGTYRALGVSVMVPFGSLITNLSTLAAFLACIIGDPLVWAINKAFPSFVDVRDLPFINRYFFIYVMKDS
jgi:hypothetical protein